RKVEPRLSGQIASAKQDRRHVVAIKDDWLTVAILIRKLSFGEGCESRHEVEPADDVVVPCASLNIWTPSDGGHAVAAFTHRPFRPTERRVARIRVDILPGTVVGGPKDVGVFVES